jgi:RimJ/RimL family protein N-acetyltransferase
MTKLGRPIEFPSPHSIYAIVAYYHETGEWPSSNWIRAWAKKHEGKGYGRAKARRALEAAVNSLDMNCIYYASAVSL